MALIFDIETLGADFDQYDETTKHHLTRWLEREAAEDQGKYQVMLKDLKQGLGFSPLTGEIIVIGVLDTIKNQGVIYFQPAGQPVEDFQQDNFTFKAKSEAEMLKSFWQGVKAYQEFVSFNGRSFDLPFLVIRSVVHKIKPSLDLMANRYLSSHYFGPRHIDLLDQFTYYGAVRRKGNLHLYCQAFGINSPKSHGITGDDVRQLYRQGKIKEIAIYNSWDLLATRQLYELWLNYFKI